MLMRYGISCRIRVNARDSWNTSSVVLAPFSISLFLFHGIDVDQVWREPRFDVHDSVSRERTFDVQEIADSLLQSSSVRSATERSAQLIQLAAPSLYASRNFLLAGNGVFNRHLHRPVTRWLTLPRSRIFLNCRFSHERDQNIRDGNDDKIHLMTMSHIAILLYL